MKSAYDARTIGRDYCQTEGSDHYKKEGGIEPLDLMLNNGLVEDFCIGNMVKYAIRFKKTRNLEDLKKVSDYAHILCGNEILSRKAFITDTEVFNFSQGHGKIQDGKQCTTPNQKEVFSYESFGDRPIR